MESTDGWVGVSRVSTESSGSPGGRRVSAVKSRAEKKIFSFAAPCLTRASTRARSFAVVSAGKRCDVDERTICSQSLFVDRFRFPIFRFEPPPRRHDIVKNNT